MKNKLLRAIFCVMLIAVTISLSACGSMRTIMLTNEDGTIDQVLYIELDPEQVASAGYNLSELQANIGVIADLEIDKVIATFKDSLTERLDATEDVDEQQSIVNALNGISKIISPVWQNNTFAVGVRFQTVYIYQTCYGIEEGSKTEMQEEKHFFYSKMYYTSYTLFGVYPDIFSEVKNYYTENYPSLNIDNSGELLYTRVTSLRREHSDADYITKVDGKYYHTWIVDRNEPSKKITVYYNTANRARCVAICLIISLTVCGICALIAFTKKPKTKIINDGEITSQKNSQ